MKFNQIKSLIKNYVEKGINYPTLYIKGAPGIGKTALINEICEEMGIYHKEVDLATIPLEYLTGLPYKTDDGYKWDKPEIFKDVPEGEKSILFFDDAHLANKQTQNYLFQLLGNKKVRGINGHFLPDKCIMIFAGNRADDKANYQVMLAPIVTRFSFIEMEVDVDQWIDWAIKNGIHPTIVSFISSNRGYLVGEPIEDNQYNNPRTWHAFSQMIDLCESSNILDVAIGTIGKEAAMEFYKFYKLYNSYNSSEILQKGASFFDNLSLVESWAAMTKVVQDVTSKNIVKVDVVSQLLNELFKNQKIKLIIPVILKNTIEYIKSNSNSNSEIDKKATTLIGKLSDEIKDLLIDILKNVNSKRK